MYNNNGIKGYFVFVAISGYMIFLVSSFSYLQQMDFRWFISMMIAVFIVLFKNTKIVINKYKAIYSLLDSLSLLIIVFVLKYAMFLSPISKILILNAYVFFYLYIFYMLVIKNKIIFIE